MLKGFPAATTLSLNNVQNALRSTAIWLSSLLRAVFLISFNEIIRLLNDFKLWRRKGIANLISM